MSPRIGRTGGAAARAFGKGLRSNVAGGAILNGVWTTRANMGYSTYNPSAWGGLNANMAVGGQTAGAQIWNGSSWSTQTNPGYHSYDTVGAGTTTAGLYFGGRLNAGYSIIAAGETWNGSAWSAASGTLPSARCTGGSGATSNAAFAASADTSPNTGVAIADTATYDGTSWTAQGNLNTARRNGFTAGIPTAGLVVGGNNSGNTVSLQSTEKFNGSTWTTSGNLLNTNSNNTYGGGGQQTAAYRVGHYGQTWVEGFNGSTWASCTGLNTALGYSSANNSSTGDGTVSMGGYDGSPMNHFETYA